MAHDDGVEPAAAARPAGRRAVLVAVGAEPVAESVGELGSDQRVTGVAAVIADDDVGVGGEQVDDLALPLDIGLAGMGQLQSGARVRQHRDLQRVVLVALTGCGREEDRRRALAAGFDYTS